MHAKTRRFAVELEITCKFGQPADAVARWFRGAMTRLSEVVRVISIRELPNGSEQKGIDSFADVR